MSIIFDARDFGSFEKNLRLQAPELQKRLRRNVRAATVIISKKMQADAPHQDSGVRKGIRYSDALSSHGAAIVIGGHGAPRSYAYAFGVGNRGAGKFKHPVFGKWSSSPATIMPTTDFIVRNWEEGKDGARDSVRLAIQETVEALSFGSLE